MATLNLAQLIARDRLTADAEWADDNPHMSDMPEGSSHWRVTLRRSDDKRRRFTVPFSMGPAHHGEPDLAGVLECLLSDASGIDQPFAEWAHDLGWSDDSIKAARCYAVCRKQTDKLKSFLGHTFKEYLEAER